MKKGVKFISGLCWKIGLSVAILVISPIPLLALGFEWNEASMYRASSYWRPVIGPITKADIWHSPSDGWSASILYEYTVEDRVFVGDRIRFGLVSESSMIESGTRKWISKYPEGSEVIVYFDPQSPENSVLERKHAMNGLVMAIFGLFAAFELMGLVFGIWYLYRRIRPSPVAIGTLEK